MLKNVRMHTVLLPKCSTVAPMARVGEGDITGNVLGQGFTSTRPCTHVQGAYGAPTGAVGGAADGRRSKRRCTFSDHHTRFSRGFLREAHSVGFTRVIVRKGTSSLAPSPTTVGGTADGTRRSTVKRFFNHF